MFFLILDEEVHYRVIILVFYKDYLKGQKYPYFMREKVENMYETRLKGMNFFDTRNHLYQSY